MSLSELAADSFPPCVSSPARPPLTHVCTNYYTSISRPRRTLGLTMPKPLRPGRRGDRVTLDCRWGGRSFGGAEHASDHDVRSKGVKRTSEGPLLNGAFDPFPTSQSAALVASAG